MTLIASDSTLGAQQSLRFRRYLLALATYIFLGCAAVVVAHIGLGDAPPHFWPQFIGLGVLINAGLAVIFLRGLNLHFKDPSLTSEQIILSSLWGIMAMHAFPGARSLILMFCIPAFCFGMLRLSTHQYLRTAASVLSIYAILLLYEYFHRPGFDLRYEAFVFCLYTALLLWLAWFGGVVNGIRSSLRSRTKDLELANEEITQRSITDDLTKLFNRRHAMSMLGQIAALSRRFDLPYSAALVDIDHFKKINDTFGHHVGDQVLQEFSRRMQEALRNSDMIYTSPWPPEEAQPTPEEASTATDDQRLIARYGGEEFLILLPGATLEQAQQTMQRVAEEVSGRPFDTPKPAKITFSAGVAQHRKDESIDMLLMRADAAMYRAKQAGRNRVECAQTDS